MNIGSITSNEMGLLKLGFPRVQLEDGEQGSWINYTLDIKDSFSWVEGRNPRPQVLWVYNKVQSE